MRVCVLLQEVYSKGFISTAFITNVTSVGELKFEVATNNRTFTFRAESDGAGLHFPHVHICCTPASVSTWLECDCYRVFACPTVERSEWVMALDDCIGEKQQLNTIGASAVPHFEGFLEHRGLRSKIYTVVLSDKVFLFKNMEVGGGVFVYQESFHVLG